MFVAHSLTRSLLLKKRGVSFFLFLFTLFPVMEFEDLGKHCAFCNQKDILPMECGSCHKYFCLQHIRQEDHKCEMADCNNNTVVICRKCRQPIKLIKGVNPSILVSPHFLLFTVD